MITAGVEAKEYVVNEVTTEVSFRDGFLAVTNIIFAYRTCKNQKPHDDRAFRDIDELANTNIAVAHVAYFGFMSETEDPRTFNKSLAMLQIIDTVLYLVSALLIYHYIGPNVQSPAISSLSPVMSKVAWGIAIPTVSLCKPCFVLLYVSCLWAFSDNNRLFSPASFLATLRASTFTCVFSAVPIRCTTAVCSPSDLGLPFASASGLFLGSSLSRFRFSMTY
jgi:hypothetical protein